MTTQWCGKLSVRSANALSNGLTTSRWGQKAIMSYDDLRKLTEDQAKDFIRELIRTNEIQLIRFQNLGKVSRREILLWLGVEETKPQSVIEIAKTLEKESGNISKEMLTDLKVLAENLNSIIRKYKGVLGE